MKSFKQFTAANDNPSKKDIQRAKLRAQSSDDEMEERKVQILAKHFRNLGSVDAKTLKEGWKRAALMGAAQTIAGAITAKYIGFPVAAGTALAGGAYALSKGGLRKDLSYRRKLKRVARRLREEKSLEQKTVKRYVKKKRKEGNAKARAFRKLYDKIGYKGNPGNFDLDEGAGWEAAKEVARSNAKYVIPAIIAPGGIPALGIKAAVEWARKAKEKKRMLASMQPA